MNDEFKHTTDHVFVNIDTEKWREYRFHGGEVVRIDHPMKLAVTPNGHRVWDGRISHYIPTGWIHLSWETKEGSPHFVA